MVKIRFTRLGRKNSPFYRIVLVDSRKKRDGMVLQQLGSWNPFSKKLVLNKEKILDALNKGAQPSETILSILKKNKIWQEFTATKQNKKKKKHHHSKKSLAKKAAKKLAKKNAVKKPTPPAQPAQAQQSPANDAKPAADDKKVENESPKQATDQNNKGNA